MDAPRDAREQFFSFLDDGDYRYGEQLKRIASAAWSAHQHRHRKRETDDLRRREVSRTSFLFAAAAIDAQLRTVLEQAGLSWAKFLNEAGLNEYSENDPERPHDFLFNSEVWHALKIYSREFSDRELDAPGLAYALLRTTARGQVFGYLSTAGLHVKIALDRVLRLLLPAANPESISIPEPAVLNHTQAKAAELLNNAWLDPSIRVASIAAHPGAGKTSLVQTWLAAIRSNPKYSAVRAFEHNLVAQVDRPIDLLIQNLLQHYEVRIVEANHIPANYADLIVQRMGTDPEILVIDGLDRLPEHPAGRFGWEDLSVICRLYAGLAKGSFLVLVDTKPFEPLMKHPAYRCIYLSKAEEPPPAAKTPDHQPDSVPTLTDEPATDDRLGRQAFAEALAERLRYIRRQNKDSPFLLNLFGPWGTGKTSLLNFLRAELERAPKDQDRPEWMVVDYNAWRQQKAGPPWWTLADSVFRGSLRRTWKYSKARAIRLGDHEYSWRLFSGSWTRVLVGVVFAWLILYALQPSAAQEPASVIERIADLGTPIAGIISLVTVLVAATRSLAPGSAEVARTFMQARSNATHRLAQHFARLIRWIRLPTIIFIDDLDRCEPKFVVELLESIQTLYRNAPVFYVVASDRKWLCQSFEVVYDDFSGAVGTPARPLGYLFIEKIFQMSIEVPTLGKAVQDRYWRDLVQPGRLPDMADTQVLEKRAKDEMKAARSEDEILRWVQDARVDDEYGNALRRAAAVRLASPDVTERTEHALIPFGPLLERNPRSMKRLVNAYGVQRTVAILRGTNVSREKLALWTILSLRWPVLADRVQQSPDLLDQIRERTLTSPQEDEIKPLLDDPGVPVVIQGEGVGGPLTTSDVRNILDE